MIKEGSVFKKYELKELLTIGAKNAAASLSQLLSKEINITPPTVEVMQYEEIFTGHHQEDEAVKAIVMKLYGAHEGVFLFVISEESAPEWKALLLDEAMQESEEIFSSGMQEVVNILVHSFLNAVVHITGVNLLSSVPILVEDMFGSILSSLYIEQEQYDNQVVIINHTYYCDGEDIEGSLYFIPTSAFMGVLRDQI